MSPTLFSRSRVILMIGLILGLALTGSGVATAQWLTKATTATPVAAGTLHTKLAGTAALGNPEISDGSFTEPVALTANNPNPVPVNYTLEFTNLAGEFNPADIEMAVWKSPTPFCAAQAPATGVTTGTLAESLELAAVTAPADTSTVLCAATRYTGQLATTDELSLSSLPVLTARLVTGDWTATATGAEFTHVLPAPLTLVPEPVGGLLCLDVDGGPHDSGVELSWLPVDGATGYEIRTEDGRLLERSISSTVFLDETGFQKGSTDVTRLSVVARNAEGESTPAYQDVRLQQGGGMGNHLRCVY